MATWSRRAGAGIGVLAAATVLFGCGSTTAKLARGSASTSSATSAATGPAGTSAPATAPPPTAAPATTLPPPAPPSSCHARGSGLDVLPDPACTPGATNPDVTQSSIDDTICRSGWTATVRPPESYTEPLKFRQMAAYGDAGSASGYEEDHLIPLELGGSPSSPLNLWPEPGASPNPKDSVENAANRAVCDGKLSLAAAQSAIAADWITFGRQLGVDTQPPPSTGAAAASGSCTVSATYSAGHHDYDVYVHSGEPDQTVTVTASGGATASWHTDSSGYADVYLSGASPGQQVTATVGGESCSTSL